MPSIDVMPDLLSLDVTAGLVSQDLRAPWKQGTNVGDAATFEIDVLDASNTSPIIITVASGDLGVLDKRIGVVMHIVIRNVTGNTAANKFDDTNQRNEAWHAVVTSPTTLALYDLDNSTGRLLPSVGNGAYTGRGSISKAFTDARILLGAEYIEELSGAIRVVFVPRRTTYEARNIAGAWNASSLADGEHDRQRKTPSFRTAVEWYEVHIWGFDYFTSEPIERGRKSFGTCKLIEHQIIRSAQSRAATCYELGAGGFKDQDEDSPSRMKLGHDYVFQLGFPTPITREAVLLSPVGTTIDAALSLQLAGGTPEEV